MGYQNDGYEIMNQFVSLCLHEITLNLVFFSINVLYRPA